MQLIRNTIIEIGRAIIPERARLRLGRLRWVREFLHSSGDSFMQYKEKGYPCEIPPMDIETGLDFLVLELPPRYMPLMPNGLGYLYNILLKCNVSFQILDANISLYHKFHENRLRNGLTNVSTSADYLLPEDPWDNTNTAEWGKEEVINHFWPELEDLIMKIKGRPPKALGISLSGINRKLAKRFVAAIRENIPGIVIVVGGYDCVYAKLGPFLFQDFDYMVIGEAEATLQPLMEAIAKGEQVRDLPGIISRYDTPQRMWSAPLLENLDEIDWPKYQWAKHHWYQTYDRKHLVPISASRGCKWSKCRFCAECFTFRKRNAIEVVNEIEHFVKLGFHSFHFNESDVNGDPQNLYDICSDIIRRDLHVNLVGQLRVDRRNTQEYLEHLARAGFRHLRFGVDGWNDRLLQIQRKGYKMDVVFQNIRDCSNAGITTTVNIVIGVPGETDEDINEVISNILKCRNYLHTIESFNTLLLACGSEYYSNPDAYKIRFRKPKEEIYREYADYIPTELWYSEEPYIDQEVRMRRLDKITSELYKHGMNIGGFASKVIENLKHKAPESARSGQAIDENR